MELLNAVYLVLSRVVPAYSYDGAWLLRDRDSGERYDQLGNFRRISEDGISAGSTLVAYPPQAA